MTTLLLVCPHFAPQNITGARRAVAFAKYLPVAGICPVVLTGFFQDDPYMPTDCAHQDPGIETDGASVFRLRFARALPYARSRFHRWLATMRQRFTLTKSMSVQWSREILSNLPKIPVPDIIWATAPHNGSFIVASHLSRLWNKPWIADFRDIPDQATRIPQWVRRSMITTQRRLLLGVSHITTVSEPMAVRLSGRHSASVTVIPNGYDPATMVSRIKPPRSGCFEIVYTGVMNSSRNPVPLIDAVLSAVARGTIPRASVRIVIYGSAGPRRRMNQLRRSVCDIRQWVDQDAVLRVQRDAHCLLLLTQPESGGVLTTKLFEYMAAGRPVLAFPRDPDVDAILTSCGIGESCDSQQELERLVVHWYQEWLQNGDVTLCRNDRAIANWSRAKQARDLADLCRSICVRSTL